MRYRTYPQSVTRRKPTAGSVEAPSLAQLILAGNNPSILRGQVAQIGFPGLILGGKNPQLIRGSVAKPGVGQIGMQGRNPSVVSPMFRNPGTGSAVYTGRQPVPVVTTGGGTTIVWDSLVHAKNNFNAQGSQTYVQMLGGQTSLNDISGVGIQTSSGDIGYGSRTQITGPGSIGATWYRFGRFPDPLDATKWCFFHASQIQDGPTYAHTGRVEIGTGEIVNGGQLVKSGQTYYIVTEVYLPALRFVSGRDSTICDVHNSYSPSVSTGPLAVGCDFTGPNIFPNKNLFFERIYQAVALVNGQDQSANPNYAQAYVWASNNAFSGNINTDFLAWSQFNWPTDTWVKIIMRYRGDPSGPGGTGQQGEGRPGTGGAGIFQCWLEINGTLMQIVNETGIGIGTNDGPYGYLPNADYFKSGLDDMGITTISQWELRRSVGICKDQGYTAKQVADAMN